MHLYLPNHAFKMEGFSSPYDSKLHEQRNELVKDRTFKVKVKVKVNQLLKSIHSQKPSKFLIYERLNFNWASEAIPTLGCSIEISHDIYICVCVCHGPKYARRITWPNMCMLKVSLGWLKQTCDTRVIHYNYYARAALAWTKKKRSLRNE